MSADHNRVTPEGRQAGFHIARMTDIEVGRLIAEGEWAKDERCASCAFRMGTVPNGCPQTILDCVKSICEKQTFSCHVPREGYEAGQHVCMGWFAAMQANGGPLKRPKEVMPWEFSPPDEL